MGDDADVVMEGSPIKVVVVRWYHYRRQNGAISEVRRHFVFRDRMDVVAMEHRDDWLRTSLQQLQPQLQQMMGFLQSHFVQDLSSWEHC